MCQRSMGDPYDMSPSFLSGPFFFVIVFCFTLLLIVDYDVITKIESGQRRERVHTAWRVRESTQREEGVRQTERGGQQREFGEMT